MIACSEMIQRMIDSFVSEWPDTEFGPAHILLSDYNVWDSDIDFCIKKVRGVLDGTVEKPPYGASVRELQETLRFLQHLSTYPEELRVGND